MNQSYTHLRSKIRLERFNRVCGWSAGVIQAVRLDFDVSPELFVFVFVEVVCLRSHSLCLMGGMFEPQRNVL